MGVTGREVTHTDAGRHQHAGLIVVSSLALRPADRRLDRHTPHIRPGVVQSTEGPPGFQPAVTAVPWDVAVTFEEDA